MRIHLTARHCELDPEDRLFAEQRLDKLSRFAHDIHEIHLTLTAEDYRHVAEITLRLKGREIVSREQANEARVAISAAIDRLELQARRLKDRRLDRRRGDRSRAVDAMNDPSQADGIEGRDAGAGWGED